MTRSFRLPSGVHPSFNRRFVPNVGLESSLGKPNALPIEETLLAANEFIGKYGYSNITIKDLRSAGEGISAEVGDDEIALEKSKAMVAFEAVIHSKLGMKRSEEDTSVSPHYGNFAEDLIVLPSGYGQTYHNARNSSGINAMSYLDVPKLRLAIDIRPMRMDHSATNDGKASMVGSRQRWIPLESPIRGIYELFSLFQDVNLGLHRDKKFPYLPSSLGGYGKEPPFRNYINFERFMHSFKQGAHSELIREVVQRTITFLEKKEKGPVNKDPLLSHIVRFQSSFHDWIKGKSIYSPVTWAGVPPEVAKYQLLKTGVSSQLDEAINRLLAERKVLSEQQLEIAVEHNELCKALLGAETILEFKDIRDKIRKEWNSFSTFSRESYGMIKELNLEMPNRLRPLRQIDVALFFELVNSKRYNLKHILREEFVYSKEAMNEIYKRGPMCVSFSMYPRVGISTRGFASQTANYMADQEDTETIGALDDLYDWVVEHKHGTVTRPMPRIIINDDEAILSECSKQVYNIVVTNDIKLCKKITKVTGNVVFRVPTQWYYQCVYFGADSWTDKLEAMEPGLNWTTHEDMGSIQSFEETNFRDGVMLSRPATQKFRFYKDSSDWKDPTILEEFLEFNEVNYDLQALLHDSRNILRQRRRYKPPLRGGERSWRDR